MGVDQWGALAQSLDALRSAFDESYEATHGFLRGSPADQECQQDTFRGDWGTQPVRDANIASLPAVFAVLDHLESLSILFRSTGGITASHTIARAALDIAIAPWYLLEPGIDVRDRVRRYMNIRLQSLQEQTQLEAGANAPIKDHANARMKEILDTAREFGFDVQRSRGRYGPPCLKPKVPSTTKLAPEIVAPRDPTLGALFWRLGSAVTHGEQHGLAMFFANSDQAVDPAHGDAAVRIQASPRDTALRCGGAPLAAIAMLRRLYTQYGWETHALESAITHVIRTWQSVAGVQPPRIPDTFLAHGDAPSHSC